MDIFLKKIKKIMMALIFSFPFLCFYVCVWAFFFPFFIFFFVEQMQYGRYILSYCNITWRAAP